MSQSRAEAAGAPAVDGGSSDELTERLARLLSLVHMEQLAVGCGDALPPTMQAMAPVTVRAHTMRAPRMSRVHPPYLLTKRCCGRSHGTR